MVRSDLNIYNHNSYLLVISINRLHSPPKDNIALCRPYNMNRMLMLRGLLEFCLSGLFCIVLL